MVKIIFDSWEVGMKKIPFIKLLNEKGGLTLQEAKILKDRLVDGNETIEIKVYDETLAREILSDAQKLNVRGRIEFL